MENRRPPFSIEGRRLGRLAISRGRLTFALCFGGTVALTASTTLIAEAQFNARGRAPRSAPSRPPQARAPTANQTHESDSSAREQGRASRDQVLIDRYRKLIIDQPGEEVPLVRLAELMRQRDGNLDQLIEELEALAKSDDATDRYGAFLSLGFFLAQQGELEGALDYVDQAIAIFPQKQAAHRFKGQLAVRMGNGEMATASFEQALSAAVEPDRTFLLRQLRTLSLEKNDIDRARAYHLKLTSSSKGNSYLEGELGRELLSRGRTTEAIEELRRVAKLQQHDARALGPALLDLGEAELEGGQHEEAIEHLRSAARLLRDNPGKQLQAQNKLAEVHRDRGDLPKYLEQLEKEARSAQSLELLGRLYEQEGQTDKALDAYRRASRLDPRNLDLKLRLTKMLELTGDLDGAVEAAKDVSRAAPSDVQLSLRLINMLLAQGHRDQAIAEWDRIFGRALSEPEACLVLADFAERLQDIARQDRALSHLSTTQTDSYRVLIDLGSRYFRKGDEDRARKTWNRILNVVRDPSEAEVIVGEVLINHEAFLDGVDLLRKARDRKPESPEVVKALALGLERSAAHAPGARQSKFQDEAIEQYEILLGLPAPPSDHSLARRHLVRLYKRRGDLALKIEQLKLEAQRRPDDSKTLRLLASAQEQAGRLGEAADTLLGLTRKHPSDIDALKELAPMQLRLGKFKEAIKTWEALVAADPQRSREYFSAMSEAAKRIGDLALALDYAEKSIKRATDDPNALRLLGELYVQQGQLDKAQEAFSRALTLDDNLDAVRLQLAELKLQTGDANGAFEHLCHLVRYSNDEVAIKRASSRLLSLGVGLGRLGDVESMLRRLSLAHPDNQVFRSLFFEVLTTLVYPLELQLDHGSGDTADQAQDDLRSLSQRSKVVLLSALSSETQRDQVLAVRLLAYDDSASTQMALVAFAEGNHPLDARLAALSAVNSPTRPQVTQRLIALADGEKSWDARVAAAAIYALRAAPDARAALAKLTESESVERAGHAALALSLAAPLSEAEATSLAARMLGWINDPSAYRDLKRAALLGLSGLLERYQPAQLSLSPLDLVDVTKQLLARESAEIAQLGLILLDKLPPSPQRRAALATALLMSDEGIRRAARHTAFVPTQTALELRYLYRQSRIEPGRFGLARLVHDIAARYHADESTVDPSAEVVESMNPALRRAASELLSTSSEDSFEVLRQLDPGGLLESLRSELKDILFDVARANAPMSTGAIRHLRPGDGTNTETLLLEALSDHARAEDAHVALRRDASAASLDLLERFERTEPRLDWSQRRRMIQTLVEIEGQNSKDLKERARAAIDRLGK